MSGGVDSSVVAGMMVRRGYEVIGVTMQIWQESQTDPRHSGCCSLGAVEDARRVARILDIPYYVVNMKEEFRQTVIQDFLDEYSAGRTPNPCVQCNRFVKFDLLMKKAKEVGCDLLATGHYARVRKNRTTGNWHIQRARAKDKDQSYALYMLSQEQIAKVRFPLGELHGKHETRAMARELKLPVANKPDSQEICFVSEAGGYGEFLKKNRPDSFVEGEVVDPDGKVLGRHDGVALYTVGQRRRIQVNAGRALYVLKVEPATNRVVVGSDEQLYKREVLFTDVVGLADGNTRVTGKIRYNMEPMKATFVPGKIAKAVFDQPVRAVTPGQTAVFYKGESVVAGGPILGSGMES